MMNFHESNKIYFKLHTAGLINQVYSLEIAFGIAFIAKRNLAFTKVSCNRTNPIPVSGNYFNGIESLIKDAERPIIFNLLDLPLDRFEYSEEAKTLGLPKIKSIVSWYMVDTPTNSIEDELFFSESRPKMEIPNSPVYLLDDAMASYSRFFYNRSKELDIFLSKIKFKKEYVQLADKIAKSIGRFKGAHIRLTDHAQIMFNATEERFLKIFDYFSDKPIPFVFCTDDHEGYLKKYCKHTIMLDQYIIQNFANDFRNLPYHDLTVFGLINLLVMTYAEEFVGTPGSTYSAYIQRCRINTGLSPEFYFVDDPDRPNDYTSQGPYSWNGYNLNPITKSWWREWSECKFKFLN